MAPFVPPPPAPPPLLRSGSSLPPPSTSLSSARFAVIPDSSEKRLIRLLCGHLVSGLRLSEEERKREKRRRCRNEISGELTYEFGIAFYLLLLSYFPRYATSIPLSQQPATAHVPFIPFSTVFRRQEITLRSFALRPEGVWPDVATLPR